VCSSFAAARIAKADRSTVRCSHRRNAKPQPAQLSQGDRIMHDQISEGFMVFVSDGAEGIGSVREIRHGLPELLVYIENAGDFVIPLSAVKAVHSDKVILDFDHLDLRMRDAIRHARDSEDPDYISPASEDE
jgi:hypothetical protein